MGARNERRRVSSLYKELDVLSWDIKCMLQLSTCQLFTDYKDLISMIQGPSVTKLFQRIKRAVKIEE